MKPVKIVGSKVYASLDYSHSLQSLSVFNADNIRYPHKKNTYWKDREGKKHHAKKGQMKSIGSSEMIELRKEFIPVCCSEDFDPENFPLGMAPGGTSSKDIIYKWHFVHRHGFPSDIYGSGRGQNAKVSDIKNHPLSYMLMCNEHHEEYDRENGEWRNPKNHRSDF